MSMENNNSDIEHVELSVHRPNPNPPSPTRAVRIERLHIENEQLRSEWKLCCSNTSPQVVKYFVSVSFSVLVMVFSIIQIVRDVDDKSIYYNLLSLIIGIFIKSPSLERPPPRDSTE